MALVIFSHGKESGPAGRKIQRLTQVANALGWETESLDYRGIDDPDLRVKKLLRFLENEVLQADQIDNKSNQPTILVGSSMGGYVSIMAAQLEESQESLHPRVHGLFLMAPAVYMPGYAQQSYKLPEVPVRVFHGWQDEIVPVDNVVKFSRENRVKLTMVDDDHPLTASLDIMANAFALFLQTFEH